ncbi:MAG: nucleotidyltransferase family protein [Alphaproteobacteria bacterium]
MTPDRAMVMAAGKGVRMQPLTHDRPKPLVDVGGKPLIDWALDMLAAGHIEKSVVNLHHFGEMLKAHLKRREGGPDILFSDESDQLLETGGGVTKALPLLGDNPFFVVNADGIWLDGNRSLDALAKAWRRDDMDALLLLVEHKDALFFEGAGDFLKDDNGRLARPPAGEGAPFIYCGIQLVSPALFTDTPDGPFSTNILWDRAIENGRLFGLVHPHPWLHVGTPQARDDAEAFLRHR